MLKVPINLDRLYSETDPAYLAWVRAVVNEVEDIRAEINAEAEAMANR